MFSRDEHEVVDVAVGSPPTRIEVSHILVDTAIKSSQRLEFTVQEEIAEISWPGKEWKGRRGVIQHP
jgi:predicted nucleotidyltransferase